MSTVTENDFVFNVRAMPRDVMRAFKTWCSSNGVTMTGAIIELMKAASNDRTGYVSREMLDQMKDTDAERNPKLHRRD